MTKDEILDYFKDIDAMYNDCTRYDTLKHMIDELQEPCTDAISRQAVTEVLLKYAHSEVGKAFAEFLVSQINDLPPVTPQYTDTEIQKMQDLEFAEIQKAYEIGKAENPNKWIPVSERLPEECGYYLISTHGCGVVESYYDKHEFWYERAHCIWTKAKAWMPLPEPYKASPTAAERSDKE